MDDVLIAYMKSLVKDDGLQINLKNKNSTEDFYKFEGYSVFVVENIIMGISYG